MTSQERGARERGARGAGTPGAAGMRRVDATWQERALERSTGTRWSRRARRSLIGAAAFLFAAFALAQAAHGSGPPGYRTVRVGVGDTVWSIASARYPDADLRQKVDDIMRANHLTQPLVYPGESLRVPSTG